MLQQLVLDACFITSSSVSLVNPLLGLALGVADFEGEGVAETLGAWLGVALLVGVGVGVLLTTVPLFQTSFFPDLTQKYLTPPVVLVLPTFGQAVPVSATACEGNVNREINNAITKTLEYPLNFMG